MTERNAFALAREISNHDQELEQIRRRLADVRAEMRAIAAQPDMRLATRVPMLNARIRELMDLHRLWADAWSVKDRQPAESSARGSGLRVYSPR